MKPMHRAVWAQLRNRPLVDVDEHASSVGAKQVEVELIEDEHVSKISR